jgi:hypothetical protein
MANLENNVITENQKPLLIENLSLKKIDLSQEAINKRRMSINGIMKEKIEVYRLINPGAFISVPKVEKTNEDYFCPACDSTGKMTSFKITGYEDFEYFKKDGEIAMGRRQYTTPEPLLICCDICGTNYQGEKIFSLMPKRIQ